MTWYASRLKEALEKRDVRVRAEAPVRVDDRLMRIDLGIPEARINIEVDGRQHLRTSEQILYDIERAEKSFEDGYATIHITNHDIHEDVDAVADAVAEAVKLRRTRLNEHKNYRD